MKRSEALEIIYKELRVPSYFSDKIKAKLILSNLEKIGMVPSGYVNPKAIEDGFEISTWRGYLQYLDKYPEHNFTYKNPRPYEYYVEGWEPEDG